MTDRQKGKIHFGIALFFASLILILFLSGYKDRHKCYDATHINCDGECTCDGMECSSVENKCPYEGLECPNAQKYTREYQLELLPDSTRIWQGDRLVNTIHYSQSIDSILLLDNL